MGVAAGERLRLGIRYVLVGWMSFSLSGAEKSALRGRGQRLEPSLKIGRDGASVTVVASLNTLLQARDLVKVRFTAADRDERGALCESLAAATASVCVGAVGHTALFYRPEQDRAGNTNDA